MLKVDANAVCDLDVKRGSQYTSVSNRSNKLLRSAVSKTNIKFRLLAGISFLKKRKNKKRCDHRARPDRLPDRLSRWMATLTGVHFSLNACAWFPGCVLCSMRQRTSTAAQIAMGRYILPLEKASHHS